MPNTGPSDGSRSTTMLFLPSLFSPSFRPMLVVVLPSPAGVGLRAVTRMSLLFASFFPSMSDSGSLALVRP